MEAYHKKTLKPIALQTTKQSFAKHGYTQCGKSKPEQHKNYPIVRERPILD